MSFLLGRSPIRRTTEYLEAGKIVFRETVKIFSVSLSVRDKHHEGAREFVFWRLPQIQYKNPNVQCVTFFNLTPTPFIRIFFENTKNVLIDVDSRNLVDIENHLMNFTAVCKTQNELSRDVRLSEEKIDSSLFGYGCKRHCICEILGQVPCPRIVPLPDCWRGKKVGVIKKFRIPPCFNEPGLEDVSEA